MTVQVRHRPAHRPAHRHAPRATRRTATSDEWRCDCCDTLLGMRRGAGLHVSFARGHEYLVALPVSCTCRRCNAPNRLDPPTA